MSKRAAPSAHDEHCSSSSCGHLGFNPPGLPPVPAEPLPVCSEPKASNKKPRSTPVIRSVVESCEELATHLLAQSSPLQKSDVERMCRLLPLQSPHQGESRNGGAFYVGMYSKGAGIAGMRTSSRTHPECVKVLTRFVKEQSNYMAKPPPFTSAVVLVNTLTGIHRDNMNSSEPNLLVAASHFGKGGIWIEDDSGQDIRKHNGTFVSGKVVPCDGKPILIPACQRQTSWHRALGR